METKTEGRALSLTDTSFRDGQQSLLGGMLRPEEMLPLVGPMDRIGFHSMEMFGGATFETQLRDMGEDPWEFVRRFKEQAPQTPLQALIRSQNLVSYHHLPDDVVELFISHAAGLGIDIFRFFDPLNDLRNLEVGINAAKKAGARVQGALCYTVSPVHNLDRWCSLAAGLAQLGCDELVIKDTSGILSPQHTWELVTAITEQVALPLGVHSHCSSGMAPMAYMAAVEAGATILDTAMSPLAWGNSQPATESVVAALRGGDYDTGLDLERLIDLREPFAALREAHVEYLSRFADRIDAEILRYNIPGRLIDDVFNGLRQHRAESRLHEALAEVARLREELGWPPLVSPIRHMIAGQAVLNVLGPDRYATVNQELKDYLHGLYGRPPVPASTEVRRQVLGRDEPITVRPADLLEPRVEAARGELRRRYGLTSDGDVLIWLLYPALAAKFFERRAAAANPPPAPVGGVEDPAAAEPDEAPAAATEPAAEPEPEPAPVAEFQVEVEGETFTVRVSGIGLSLTAAPAGAATASAGSAPVVARGAVLAPMQGLIVKIPVSVGDQVKVGDVVAILEAMKMQNDISATANGTVTAIYVKEGDVVSPGQAILAVG